MGDYFEGIVDVQASPAEAAALASSLVDWLVGEGIMAERTDSVFGSDGGHAAGPRYASAVTEPDDILLELKYNGVEVSVGPDLFESTDPGPVECPRCDEEIALEDLDTGEPTDQWDAFWAAYEAWDGAFIARVGRHLGHRVVTTMGKL